jgi:hypothetical protein
LVCGGNAIGRELSRTHKAAVIPVDSAMREAAAALGIQTIHVLIEDLSGVVSKPAGNQHPADTVPLPEYSQHLGPFVFGTLVEYYDDGSPRKGQLCIDIVNYATLLNPDMFILGKEGKHMIPTFWSKTSSQTPCLRQHITALAEESLFELHL